MTRVYELIRELGSIVENDLSPDDCAATSRALGALLSVAQHCSLAKRARLGGDIAGAVIQERHQQRAYGALPEAAQW